MDILIELWKYLATVATVIAIPIAIYSWLRFEEIVHRETEKAKQPTPQKETPRDGVQFDRIEELLRSSVDSDWKIAILEADAYLDEALKGIGYAGDSMGERLKSVPAGTFPFLEEAWEVHKLRNALAHDPTYPLSHEDADKAISVYDKIFRALGKM